MTSTWYCCTFRQPLSTTHYHHQENCYSREIRLATSQSKCNNHNAKKKVEVSARLYKRQAEQKVYYDQHARGLPDSQIGQCIRMHDKNKNKWTSTAVTQTCMEPRSFIILTPSRPVLHRNQKHLRENPYCINSRNGSHRKNVMVRESCDACTTNIHGALFSSCLGSRREEE